MYIPPAFTDTQAKDPAKVSYLFKQALTLINELGAIKTKPGEFFWKMASKPREILFIWEISLRMVLAMRKRQFSAGR